MRAAVISNWPRARNWQSQRVTRRSFGLPAWARAATVFHPVPSQRGQTSAGALITWGPSVFEPAIFELIIFKRILLFRLCTRIQLPRKPETLPACVHPVKEDGGLWRA